jgi:hypothetical protein
MRAITHKISINSDFEKFQNFLRTFGATRLLLQRAHENGFLIEGLVLYASLVDAFCRICLILKEQIKKNTDEINEKSPGTIIAKTSGGEALLQSEWCRNLSQKEIREFCQAFREL